jgi:serine protease inhibitor
LPPRWIFQEATIAVDEQGVETSSTTVAGAELGVPRWQIRLIFDHPFTFAIVDDAKRSVIFTGIVADP